MPIRAGWLSGEADRTARRSAGRLVPPRRRGQSLAVVDSPSRALGNLVKGNRIRFQLRYMVAKELLGSRENAVVDFECN